MLVFNTQRLLSQRLRNAVTKDYDANATVFSQGDPANAVYHIVTGEVHLSAVSHRGKEATLAVLGSRAFFGEPCLISQSVRYVTARTVVPSTIIRIPKRSMEQALRSNPAFATSFAAYVVKRQVNLETAFMNHIFDSSERRLARLLVMLAHLGRDGSASLVVPKVSQTTLASMVGVTRERVSALMNKFRRLGLIDYNHDLHVRSALLRLLLAD